MTDLRDIIVTWTDQYLQEILAAPRMWGSLEAVEMQVLQLLEVRALALRPDQELSNPRRVLDSYAAFLRERYPNQPTLPLFELIARDKDEREFVLILAEFRTMMARAVLPENPFAHSQLAVKLTFDVGHQPTASAVTGYYEEFRRALRATARNDSTMGRAKKEIESVTDFALEDAVVTRPNGAAGQVLLRLGTGGQDGEAEERVREGISKMLTLAEWAGSGADLEDLTVDDPEQRTRIAVQARRLLPRRGIETVAVGGLFVARSRPVEFRASYEKRFLEVVSSESTPIPFDQTDEIRAIDLDRGLIVLGKQRTQCFITREDLGNVSGVGVRARVRGQQYRPLLGKTFVLAEHVETEPNSNDI